MLIFGDYRSLPLIQQKQFKIYNLSGLVEGYQSLRLIPQDVQLSSIMMDDNSFVEQYMSYIFNNDTVFIEFMKVIMDLYLGDNVFILNTFGNNVLGENVFERIAESLIKIIDLRYGYKSYIINEPEDLLEDYDYLDSSTEFQIYGLANLDIDKERLVYLTGGK